MHGDGAVNDPQHLACDQRTAGEEKAQLGIEIDVFPATCEESGLATSSRNHYLDPEQTGKAALIYQLLGDCARQISEGERDFKAVEARAVSRLGEAGFKTDYFTVCNAETLLPASVEDRNLVILVTAGLGSTRLLDNIEISPW
jgi:pantoate--beta-alanine ligase